MKGDVSMDLPRTGSHSRVSTAIMALILIIVPVTLWAQEYREFVSEDYGFSMRYPATWVKIDKPKGNYYVVFQAPDLTDNFRPRIHVAAHKPVKDPINVFLQEFRNGIKDLQLTPGAAREKKEQKQEVRIIDEGEFKCEVPGAYYFLIQALEDKLKIWMDIVIVFYKNDQTLLRMSCLAPSSAMEKFQPLFNDVLVSVKFTGGEVEAPPPPRTTAPPPPPPGAVKPQVLPGPPPPPAPQPQVRPSPPALAPGPAPEVRPQPPAAPTQPPPAPRSGPRGPLREPERPATGIVN